MLVSFPHDLLYDDIYIGTLAICDYIVANILQHSTMFWVSNLNTFMEGWLSILCRGYLTIE